MLGPSKEKEVTGGRRKLSNEHHRNFPIFRSNGEDCEHCLARCDAVWFGRQMPGYTESLDRTQQCEQLVLRTRH